MRRFLLACLHLFINALVVPAHAVQYERRRPEQTLLHLLVREHLETFLAQVEARTGRGLPAFVRDEFEAFLQCGILAHGSLRVRCADCAHEKLMAFSCKRRGFCPSCGARRMAQSAAVFVDEVIPRVPVRQWVLSFPTGLRILFAARPELLPMLLWIIQRVIAVFLLEQAGLKRITADTGAVTLIQRFGSAAGAFAGRLIPRRNKRLCNGAGGCAQPTLVRLGSACFEVRQLGSIQGTNRH